MAEKKKTQNDIVSVKENEEIVLALPEKERAAKTRFLWKIFDWKNPLNK